MNLTNRAEHIESLLTAWIVGICGAEISVWEQEAWDEESEDDPARTLNRLTGIMPAAIQADGTVEVSICPAVIDRVTAHLNDELAEVYLDAVRWIIGKEVILADMPEHERRHVIEHDLAATYPGSLTLVASVQSHAVAIQGAS